MMASAASAKLPVWLNLSPTKLKRTPPLENDQKSRGDNSVIMLQYIKNKDGPLCPFTDTSLCRLGRYRLQIWEEPLRFLNWLVHNRKTLYLHN